MESEANVAQLPRIRSVPEFRGRSWLQWCPTSKHELHVAEQQMLRSVKTPYRQEFVEVDGHQINTLYTLPNAVDDKPNHTTHPPLVLVHGFGAGIGFWCLNLDALSKHYTVYCFDLLGFGKSSRPALKAANAYEAERWWIDSIEKWADKMNLRDVVLAGHSLGGFLTGAYALQYPERIRKLVLIDPVGLPKKAPEEEATRMNWKWKAITSVVWKMPLFTVVRAAGRWGPDLVKKARPDLTERFPYRDDTVADYLYHLLVQEPSGENAFSMMFKPFAWAQNPLVDRLHQCRVKDITFLYGSHSWMDPAPAAILRDKMRDTHNVKILMVNNAGHHVYADNADAFHAVLAAHK